MAVKELINRLHVYDRREISFFSQLYHFVAFTLKKPNTLKNMKQAPKSIYLLNDLMASANMFLNGNLGVPDWISSLHGNTQFAFFQRKICPHSSWTLQPKVFYSSNAKCSISKVRF